MSEVENTNETQVTKKPVYKKWWFWVIVVIVLGIIGMAMGGGYNTTQTDPEQTEETALIEPERFPIAEDGSFGITAEEAAKTFISENTDLKLVASRYDSPMTFFIAEDGTNYFGFIPNDNGNLSAVLCWNANDPSDEELKENLIPRMEKFLGANDAWIDNVNQRLFDTMEGEVLSTIYCERMIGRDTTSGLNQYLIMTKQYVEENKEMLDGAEVITEQKPEQKLEQEPEQPIMPTLGEQNALDQAFNYLSFMAFSYNGLIQQLEYEGYTTEEATYAADNCGADWNEQAARKAGEYLSTMAFSRQGLIDQLLYEGFTQEQAEYGVSQNGY